MNRISFIALLGVLGFAATLAVPQDYDEEERPRRQQPPTAGFWPTQRQMALFIDRLTEDELARTYGFDEDQVYNTQELLRQRVPAWLNENRAEIMQLTNEYIEAALSREAPDPAYVAAWSQRVLPLFNEFVDLAEDITTDMREYMTEDQHVILDGQLAAFRVGVKYMNRRLGGWAEGGFDAETDWHRSEGFHEEEIKRQQEANADMQEARIRAMGQQVPRAADAGANQPGPNGAKAAPPQDEWTRYVEDFIRRYQLNHEQQAQAHRVLKSVQEQRDRYLRRPKVKVKIAEAEQMLKQTKTEEQRAAVAAASEELTRPLDRMFQQLKEKLEPIPTRKQRQAAAQAEAQRGEKPKRPDTKSEPTASGAKREGPSSP